MNLLHNPEGDSTALFGDERAVHRMDEEFQGLEERGSRRLEAAGTLDEKLLAIITAALAASSGAEPRGFRVSGVWAAERTGFSTPVWGHADRLARIRLRA